MKRIIIWAAALVLGTNVDAVPVVVNPTRAVDLFSVYNIPYSVIFYFYLVILEYTSIIRTFAAD